MGWSAPGRAELLASGVTHGQLRGPKWQRTGHGRYLPHDIDVTACLQRILDAGVRLPDGGAVGGWASARVHGVDECDGLGTDGRTPLDVPLVLPGPRIRGAAGLALWCDPLEGSDVVEVGGIRFTRAPRTAFDRMRLVWLLDADLPRPMCNPPVFDLSGELLGFPDLFDPVAAVVFEYDGAGHRTTSQHDRDNRREELFEEHGLVVARVGRADIDDRRTLADRMRRTRQRGLRRDRRADAWDPGGSALVGAVRRVRARAARGARGPLKPGLRPRGDGGAGCACAMLRSGGQTRAATTTS